MDANALRVKLNYANKRVSFAWAKYYESVNERLGNDYNNYRRVAPMRDDVSIPQHIKDDIVKMMDELKKHWECPICLEMIKPQELDITNCGHYFCKGCLTQHKANAKARGAEHCNCPNCRRKISVE